MFFKFKKALFIVNTHKVTSIWSPVEVFVDCFDSFAIWSFPHCPKGGHATKSELTSAPHNPKCHKNTDQQRLDIR